MSANRQQHFEPLTLQERAQLKSASGFESATDILTSLLWMTAVAALFFWICSNLAWLLWNWLALIPYRIPQRDWITGAWMPMTIYFFVRQLIWHRRNRLQVRNNGAEKPFAADLAGGIAAQEDLRVTRAMELGEYEDEGLGFLLELEGGGVLCLINQDYYAYGHDAVASDDMPDERGDFPQTTVRYRYGPNSGLPFSATGVGASLRPSHRIPGTQKVQLRTGNKRSSYVSPEDGSFYPGTLEDVCAQFNFRPETINDL